MSLESYTKQFYYIPVGFVQSIIDAIELVAEIQGLHYLNSDDILDTSMLSQGKDNEIKPDWERVDMMVTFYIDESMAHSFGTYLEKMCDKYKEDYKHLVNCWSLEQDE